MSATKIQRLASAAQSDGLRHPTIERLASLGSSGQHPQNCHRDLVGWMEKPALHECISVVQVSAKSNLQVVTQVDMKMLLPHEVFACIYQHHPT
eukprot:8907479-Alexandrium_andersonii.AAC.1